MTSLRSALPFAALLTAVLCGAPAAATSTTTGEDPLRLQLRPTGLLLAAKKADKAAKKAAADDVLDGEPEAEKKPATGEDGAESHSALPDAEVEVGGTVLGQSMGGATGFVFKQGIYTQSDLGGFFVLGAAAGSPTGFTISEECNGPPCKAALWSQLQPYIGLSVGYDISQWLGVQLSFGTGFVANAAIYNQTLENPRDYGITTVNGAIVGSFCLLERLAIMGKLFGGAAFVSPEPAPNEPTLGGNAGVGFGVRYATLLPDVFVGLDGNVMVAFIPSSGGSMVIIPGISFAPVIKYVF